MIEQLIRTVKEQCLWLHNFESLSAAWLALGRWFQFYNHERPSAEEKLAFGIGFKSALHALQGIISLPLYLRFCYWRRKRSARA